MSIIKFLAPVWLLATIILLIACSSYRTQAENTNFVKFEKFSFIEPYRENTANISVGDLNKDGHLDLVLAKGRHWSMKNKILFGNGAGDFTSKDLSLKGDRSYSALLVDINLDGHLDVVVSNDRPDEKKILFGDSSGNFSKTISFGKNKWPSRQTSVADVNSDGLPDIIIANRKVNGGANYYCLNDSSDNPFEKCIKFSSEPATSITPADLNNDRLVDLIVPHREGGQSYVYFNHQGAPSKKIPFGPADASFRLALAADLNNDGLGDIVGIDDKKGSVAVFYNKENSFSSAELIYSGDETPYALSVVDINKDGMTDVLVGFKLSPSKLFYQRKSGLAKIHDSFGDSEGTTYAFGTGDFNEDGVIDVVLASSGGRTILYFGEETINNSNR